MEDPVSAAQPIQTVIEVDGRKSASTLGLAMLFIVGCAVGGVLVVAMGMFEASL